MGNDLCLTFDIASALQSDRAGSKSRKAGASRTSKRKASGQTAEPDLKAESDSDKMEVDQVQNEEQDDDEEAPEAATPDRSDDETEGENEESMSQAKSKSLEAVRSGSVSNASADEDVDSVGVPPPRSLPFGRRATRSKNVDKATPAGDEDDETEDEEL